MRKIILDLAVSLDGFIESPNGEIYWCIMNNDMDFGGFLKSIDTIFYGKVSYDLWGNFKPGPSATGMEQEFWQQIHTKKKYVFTTREIPQSDAIPVSGGVEKAIADIKAQEGQDIWLYGGANIIKTFVALELIDVYRLSIHPVALGSGKPLFENLTSALSLKLQETKTFRSGVVQHIYVPVK